MQKKILLAVGWAISQASFAKAVQTPAQLADGNGQIANAYGQEYYLGGISPNQSLDNQSIVWSPGPAFEGSVCWYSFNSDGVTPISFDIYGSSFGFGGGAALKGGNIGEMAVYDSNGNFIAENKGGAVPSTGDSNLPPVLPAGVTEPPQDTLHQPFDPTQPEGYYSTEYSTFYNTNDQGFATISFVKNPQSNPLFTSTNSVYNWNQYPILPAGTYFLAVAGYSTYFTGSPTDAAGITEYGSQVGVTSSTPYGYVDNAVDVGYYNLNERVAGDFNGDGVANLSDLRLLRLQVAEYLSTQGIASAGYSGGTWAGLPEDVANPQTDLQQYDLTGNSRIDQNDIAAFGRYTGMSTVVSLTWNNTQAAAGTDPQNPGGAGDGTTWDVETSQNFNDTVGSDVFFNGDLVTFNDANNGQYAVTLNSVVTPGAVTFANSAGNYVISGTGSINGSTGLLKTGTGKLTMSVSNTYTGGTNVSGGTLALTVTGALPINTALTISSGALVQAVNHGTAAKVVLQTSSLSIAGSTNSWTGTLDLANNDLVAHGGNVAQLTNQIKTGFGSTGNWQGSGGITSSAAATDTKHLTALGVIQNSTNGSPSGTALYTSFDGVTVADTDVLVKYTYYGDTNLDGKVDASDYSKIDSGFLTHATGWANGDFNYDGTINGSDYTLIDNAFNTQGAVQTAVFAGGSTLFATSTAEIATTPVPEPGTLALSLLPALGLLRRRRSR